MGSSEPAPGPTWHFVGKARRAWLGSVGPPSVAAAAACCLRAPAAAAVRPAQHANTMLHLLPQFEESTTGDRLHGVVEGRYITVIRHEHSLFAIDSVCFHGTPTLAARHRMGSACCMQQSLACTLLLLKRQATRSMVCCLRANSRKC